VRKIEREERRARLGRRHWLATKARDPVTVAGDLVGLHSSDPATVYLSAQARVEGLSVAGLEKELYQKQSLIRMHAMRRTMFVVPTAIAPTLDAAVTQKVEAVEKKRLAKMMEEQGLVKHGLRWIERVLGRIIEEVQARGEASTTELSDCIPGLKSKVLRFGEGTRWEGRVAVSSRLMYLAAMTGEVVRGRPAGTWISSQYAWLPGKPRTGMRDDDASARADLVRRWLQAYGPGTPTDLKWWSGLTMTQVRQALTDVGAEKVAVEEGTGYVLPEDGDDTDPGPWVALLPGLDSTVMGWKERSWFLGNHEKWLFDRNGNAGPTVWANGRIIGGWGQPEGPSIRFKLLEEVDSTTDGMVDAAARELEAWLAGVRITPRFPVPLSRELG
jgi:hypothetical protein